MCQGGFNDACHDDICGIERRQRGYGRRWSGHAWKQYDYETGRAQVRRLYHGKVVAGFAGSVADAFTLFEKFEKRLEEYQGNLQRAAVELAQEWRSDKVLHKLEAMLLVMNEDDLFIVSGGGEVIQPDDGICAIGSGGAFALSAGRALARNTDLPAEQIAKKALEIASEICVFTNDHIIVETVG